MVQAPARVAAAASPFSPPANNNNHDDADSLHANAGSPPDVRSVPSPRRQDPDFDPPPPPPPPLDAAFTSDSNTDNEKTPAGGEAHLRFTIDPAGKLTHDETAVDIVTVPCPGANPLGSWSRDGLVGRYFGAPSMRDAAPQAPGTGTSGVPGPSWVRQGIRREADRARILLYAHPEPLTTLGRLADALLAELHALMLSEQRQRSRPLIFLAHSLGGLIVKMALVKASRSSKYEGLWRACYGVAFFGELIMDG
jgi:hypothetical protein